VRTRAESAAATRRALLEVASALLDRGGVDAVTLRDVGAGAGVSRSAAYRHFADKDAMLAALSAAAWSDLADRGRAIADDVDLDPKAAVRQALNALMAVARTRPHLYQLMQTMPPSDPDPAVNPLLRSQTAFLVVVGRMVGTDRVRPSAGLLLSAAHGIASLEVSGNLDPEKYQADGDQLLELLLTSLTTR
jgi:AcrR family transcriptional regulator